MGPGGLRPAVNIPEHLEGTSIVDIADRLLIGTVGGLRTPAGEILVDVDVTSLAAATDGWWLLAGGRDLFRIRDGSQEQVASIDGPEGRCVIGDGEGALVGTAEGHLLRVAGDGLVSVESFDSAEGRDAWYTPWGGPPDTRSLARDAAGTLLANVHVGGILRSSDAGATWTPTLDIDDDVHQVLAHPTEPGRAFAAAAVGLVWSNDAGGTWTRDTDGLQATYARGVAIAGETLLLSASEGHRGHRAAVYRRPLEGGPFERCTDGLPEWFDANVDSHWLAGTDDLAAFGTANGRVFASQDEGATWELVAEQLPPIRAVAIVA
jgi:hypothetical protein